MATANASPIAVEGIFDRVGNLRELLALFNSGVIAEGLAAWKALQDGDYGEVVIDIGDIAALQGVPEADAIRNLGVAIKTKDIATIVKAVANLVSVAADRLKTLPTNDGGIRVMGSQRTETFTAAQSKAYLADHRADVRKGANGPLVNRLLRNAPEVLAGLKGEPATMAMSPERLAKIMEIVRKVIPVLTVVSAFVPYLTPLVIVLKLILARYDAAHPQSGQAMGNTDVGLDLADLA